MDIEQLKLILDLVRDAGQGAWWIALLWILKPYVSMVLWSIFGSVVFWQGFKCLGRITFSSRLCSEMGITWPPLQSEQDRIIKALRKGRGDVPSY